MFVCEFVVWKNYIPFITLTQNGKLCLYCQINRFEWLALSYNPITSMQNADTDCSCSFNRLICVICPSSCMNKEVCNIKSVWKQHSNLSTEFINWAISIEDDWYIVWHHPDLILKWALRINEPSQYMHVKKKKQKSDYWRAMCLLRRIEQQQAYEPYPYIFSAITIWILHVHSVVHFLCSHGVEQMLLMQTYQLRPIGSISYIVIFVSYTRLFRRGKVKWMNGHTKKNPHRIRDLHIACIQRVWCVFAQQQQKYLRNNEAEE